jgi:hypothetical protein
MSTMISARPPVFKTGLHRGVTTTVASVTDEMTNWIRERRDLPQHLLAGAAANPGGSVAEIDGAQITNPDGYMPPEAIKGVYPVDSDGHPTGEFIPNPRYGPIRDDFTRLESPDHWLGWLPDTPSAAVRTSLEEMLSDQVSGSVVEWVKVIEEPVFLTGGRRASHDPEHVIVTRAALAVSLAFAVMPPDVRREVLTAVLSWAAAGLDTVDTRNDRVWLDFAMNRERAEQLLHQRIYNLEAQD